MGKIYLLTLEKTVNKALNSTALKKKYASTLGQYDEIKLHFRRGVPTKSRVLTGYTLKDIAGYITELKEFLYIRLNETFGIESEFNNANNPAIGSRGGNLMSHKLIIIDDNGKQGDSQIIYRAAVRLTFNPDAVHRDSFSSNFPNGVDNILKMITLGWDYSWRLKSSEYNPGLFGTWRGQTVWARTKTSPQTIGVMKFLIDEYNRTRALENITAILDPSYYQ